MILQFVLVIAKELKDIGRPQIPNFSNPTSYNFVPIQFLYVKLILSPIAFHAYILYS